MTLVNGVAIDAVAAADRGLAYGDGVFRTLRTQDGAPLWWDDHYAKLAVDAAALGLVCPEKNLLEAELQRVALPGDAVAKIILTRGVGARGYAPPAEVNLTRIVAASPLPGHAGATELRVRVCRLRLARQPRLAGIKHLNRLENVLARAEWSDPAIAEGLLADADGLLVCAVSANVFLLQGGELLTPELDHCGVAGVARARLLAAVPCRVARVSLAELARAEEIFLSNSVTGVRRVAELDSEDTLPRRVFPDTGWRARLAAALA
jgi:4-amino-4-deoxychorismate lyase